MADAEKWLATAEADLAVADHLNTTMYPAPLEIICYHCQQAGEKAVKALLVYQGENVRKTHDIAQLIDSLSEFMDVDESVFEAAERLTPYGVQVRYPQEMQIEAHHAREALGYARHLVQWAKSRLK